MKHSTTLRKVYPAVEAAAEVLSRWITPSALLPEGQAGFVRINDGVYMLLPIATKGKVVGWRFTKSNSTTHDVDCTGREWTCDCPDATFRGRKCKHVSGLLQLLAVEKVLDAAAEPEASWDDEVRWAPTAAALASSPPTLPLPPRPARKVPSPLPLVRVAADLDGEADVWSDLPLEVVNAGKAKPVGPSKAGSFCYKHAPEEVAAHDAYPTEQLMAWRDELPEPASWWSRAYSGD